MLNIDEESIQDMDQFVFRFMILQDCIVQRLFSSLLDNLQEDYSTKPFLDILNRLEKLRAKDFTTSRSIYQAILCPSPSSGFPSPAFGLLSSLSLFICVHLRLVFLFL